MVGGLLGSSLRSLQLMTGNMFNDKIVEFLLHVFNGRYCSAVLRLCGVGRADLYREAYLDDDEQVRTRTRDLL